MCYILQIIAHIVQFWANYWPKCANYCVILASYFPVFMELCFGENVNVNEIRCESSKDRRTSSKAYWKVKMFPLLILLPYSPSPSVTCSSPSSPNLTTVVHISRIIRRAIFVYLQLV